jgi:hypothetical protein
LRPQERLGKRDRERPGVLNPGTTAHVLAVVAVIAVVATDVIHPRPPPTARWELDRAAIIVFHVGR